MSDFLSSGSDERSDIEAADEGPYAAVVVLAREVVFVVTLSPVGVGWVYVWEEVWRQRNTKKPPFLKTIALMFDPGN